MAVSRSIPSHLVYMIVWRKQKQDKAEQEYKISNLFLMSFTDINPEFVYTL